MWYQINKVFRAGREQKENWGNATAIKMRPFLNGEMRVCELDMSLTFKIQATHVLNYFR